MTEDLELIEAEVLRARRTFLTSLDGVPIPLRPIILDAYMERSPDGPSAMGERVVWLLTDLLPGATWEAARQVAPYLFGLRTHNVMLDDVFDGGGNISPHQHALASNLVFQRSLTQLLRELPDNSNVQVRIDEYYVEQAVAAHAELQARGNLVPFEEQDIERMGKKCSLCKVYAVALMFASGCSDVEDELLVPVQDFATFIQFLDDVTDWEEDWYARNYTYLLTHTCSCLGALDGDGSFNPEDYTSRDIFTAMVITGGLEDTLEQAARYLVRVLKSPQLKPDSTTERFLRNILAEKELLVRDIGGARQLCLKANANQGVLLHTLTDLAQQPDVREQVDFVGRRLRIVSQRC